MRLLQRGYDAIAAVSVATMRFNIAVLSKLSHITLGSGGSKTEF